MKIIMTKYIGPTNTKGARIKADDGDGNSLTVAWDYNLDVELNHALAAMELATKMKWTLSGERGWFKHQCFHMLNPKCSRCNGTGVIHEPGVGMPSCPDCQPVRGNEP